MQDQTSTIHSLQFQKALIDLTDRIVEQGGLAIITQSEENYLTLFFYEEDPLNIRPGQIVHNYLAHQHPESIADATSTVTECTLLMATQMGVDFEGDGNLTPTNCIILAPDFVVDLLTTPEKEAALVEAVNNTREQLKLIAKHVNFKASSGIER